MDSRREHRAGIKEGPETVKRANQNHSFLTFLFSFP
jgi:hypothetical protein